MWTVWEDLQEGATGRKHKLVLSWSIVLFQNCDWHGREPGCKIQAPPVLLALNCRMGIEQQQTRPLATYYWRSVEYFHSSRNASSSSILAQHQHIPLLFTSPAWFHSVMLVFAPCPKTVAQWCFFALNFFFYLLNCSSNYSIIHSRV